MPILFQKTTYNSHIMFKKLDTQGRVFGQKNSSYLFNKPSMRQTNSKDKEGPSKPMLER
jgi:hypothetical protein